ncbi:RNA-directed DNA polymerase, eukaryota [Tanacetum coccineum]
MISSVNLVPMADRWVWNLESSGDFSVSSIRKVIDEKRFPSVCSKTRWVKYVSIKVNVLAWKIKIDGLPTRFNISRRGIDIHSILCPVCDGGVESSEHLFFRCHLSKQIARKVSLWWNVAYVDVNSYAEWYSWIVSLRIAAKSKLMLEDPNGRDELIDTRNQSFTCLDIQRITNSFNTVIGKGGFGTVYYGYIGNNQVAVKMLSESSAQGYRELQAELKLWQEWLVCMGQVVQWVKKFMS